MSDVSVVASEPNKAVSDIIVRLADEGVPVRAIARVTKWGSDEVRELLLDAQALGNILQIPRDDWPVGTTREQRLPGLSALLQLDDEAVVMTVQRCFGVTPLQAHVLIQLIKRREVSKSVLHTASMRTGATEETNPKIVDVIICHLRKRIAKHDLRINTLWGYGFCMSPEDRRKASAMLSEFTKPEPEVTTAH